MGGTVTVACKVPNGLVLQNWSPRTQRVPVLGGGERDELIYDVPKGAAMYIKGPAYPRDGSPPRAEIAGGYALTFGVDADAFEEWMAMHADADIVINKLIFWHEKAEDARAEAKEKRDVRSGLEPIDVGRTTMNGRAVPKDPRMPRGQGNLSAIEPYDPNNT